MPQIITPKEAAQFLNLNLYTLYAYTRKKIIPSIRISKLIRYDLDDLKKWVEAHKTREED